MHAFKSVSKLKSNEVTTRIAGRYIENEYESCLDADMLLSNRRLLIRTYVTIMLSVVSVFKWMVI